MIKEAESALRTMARALHPTNKSGFVRVMLPAIEDALRAGHTRKAVWQQLHEQNPALGYKEFCVYLGRLRKRAHQSTALKGEEKVPTAILSEVSHTSRRSSIPWHTYGALRRIVPGSITGELKTCTSWFMGQKRFTESKDDEMAETFARRSLSKAAAAAELGGFNSGPARLVHRTRSASPTGKIVTSRPLHSV